MCDRYQSTCTGVASYFYFIWSNKTYFKVLTPPRLVKNCKSVTFGSYFHESSTPELSSFQEYIQWQGDKVVTRRTALVISRLFKEITRLLLDQETWVQQLYHSHHNEMLESGASHLAAYLLIQLQTQESSVSMKCCQGSGLGSCSPKICKHSFILRLPRHSTSFFYQPFYIHPLVTPWALAFETHSSKSINLTIFFYFSPANNFQETKKQK